VEVECRLSVHVHPLLYTVFVNATVILSLLLLEISDISKQNMNNAIKSVHCIIILWTFGNLLAKLKTKIEEDSTSGPEPILQKTTTINDTNSKRKLHQYHSKVQTSKSH